MGLFDMMNASQGGTMDDYLAEQALKKLPPDRLAKLAEKIRYKSPKARVDAAPKLPRTGAPVATKEFRNGQMVSEQAQFRAYDTPADSSADYLDFLKTNPRYGQVLAAPDLPSAIQAMGSSGYATDPQYGQKLASITAQTPEQEQFLNARRQELMQNGAAPHLAELGARQSALETGWGKSLAGGGNFYGIKAHGKAAGPRQGRSPIDTRMAGDDTNAGMPVPAVDPRSMDPVPQTPMEQGFNPVRMPEVSKDSGRARTMAMSGSKLGSLAGLMFGYGGDGYTFDERQQMLGQASEQGSQAAQAEAAAKYKQAVDVARIRAQGTRGAGGVGAAPEWHKLNDGTLYSKDGQFKKDENFKTPAEKQVELARTQFAEKEAPQIVMDAQEMAGAVLDAKNMGATGIVAGTLGKVGDITMEAVGGGDLGFGGPGTAAKRNWLRSNIDRLGQEETLKRLKMLGGSDTEKEYQWLRKTQADPKMMESQLDEWAWSYLGLTAKALRNQGQDPSEILALQQQFRPPMEFSDKAKVNPKGSPGKAAERADSYIY
jgi:hypothetical protein